MTMQSREKILQILYKEPARGPVQTLNREDLIDRMAIPWDDIRDEVTYLEEKGYIVVKRRSMGTRVFDAFYITTKGVDLVEVQSIESHDAPTTLLESIPLPSESSEKTEYAVTIFFSYAHKDEALRKELEKHLKVLQHQGLINMWYDRKISAGTEWKLQIDTHLNTAQVILLLVSPDFMSSDYCYGREMKRAMERHESGEARIIPILLRPVYYEGAPFEKFQMLPTNGKPITRWPHRDEAFEEIAKGISKAVKELTSAPAHFPSADKQSNSQA